MVAKCCCGACSIEVEGPPVLNGVCHCANCKRRTGGAFGWSCYFRSEDVTAITGQFETYRIGSHNPQERHFCAACGTTLHWTSDFMPGHHGVAGGCFRTEEIGPPTVTVSNADRCDWVGLPEAWATTP